MKRRVGGLSESDLLGQRAIREIQQQRHTLEALRQHSHVRRASGRNRQTRGEHPLALVGTQLSNIDAKTLVGSRADGHAEDPGGDEPRCRRRSVQKRLQRLKAPHIVDHQEDRLSSSFFATSNIASSWFLKPGRSPISAA